VSDGIKKEFALVVNKINEIIKIKEKCTFSIMRYEQGLQDGKIFEYNPKKTLFKVELEKNYSELTLRTPYEDIVPNLTMYFDRLFTLERKIGSIEMKDIIKDAKPINPYVSKFFKPHPKSLYKKVKKYPVGLHAGHIKFIDATFDEIIFRIEDMNEESNLTGNYILENRRKIKEDPWGRKSLVLILKKK
jgi:hypothetical protein